jgi:hypothetical protein
MQQTPVSGFCCVGFFRDWGEILQVKPLDDAGGAALVALPRLTNSIALP